MFLHLRLVGAMTKLEKSLDFVRDDELGYLTFCPTNLGTTLRASVHLRFSGLTASEVEAAASELGLQVRGTSGEHTEVAGGVFDLSNRRRLGITEFQAVRNGNLANLSCVITEFLRNSMKSKYFT